MAARCGQSSHQNQYHPHRKKYQRVENQFTVRGDQSWSIKNHSRNPAGGDSLTGNGLNLQPSDACLTATRQLPASRVKTSDRKSTFPLDANVGHTCSCFPSYIKNGLLTDYSPQIGSDLLCLVCCGSVIFHRSAVTVVENIFFLLWVLLRLVFVNV